MSSRSSIAKIVFVVTIAALAACTSTPKTQVSTALDDDAITVGSFDFEESALLAEMYSQALEGRGFVVDRRFEIGPRELVAPRACRPVSSSSCLSTSAQRCSS